MLSLLLCFVSFAGAAPLESGEPVTLTAGSALLAEVETGAVIFEKNGDDRRQVASITKLMTALLVLEAIRDQELALTDQVTISQTAAAMKGSQALLDAGAAYSVEQLLKTTIMASANDSAVALAEHLAGSEAGFVERMNARAAQLGMGDTCYVNCTGYPQSGQHTTARDILKVAQVVNEFPLYHTFASVWMDTLNHPGGRVTELTNTNRLVRFYESCDGFKTGSTDEAKFCVCATAQRNGLRLVAIVLGVPNSQTRFNEARAMLDYGFANYKRVVIADKGELLGKTLPVKGGSSETVELMFGRGLSMLLKNGQEKQISFQATVPSEAEAPIALGDTLGSISVLIDGATVAKLPCAAAGDVPRPGFIEALYRLMNQWR